MLFGLFYRPSKELRDVITSLENDKWVGVKNDLSVSRNGDDMAYTETILKNKGLELHVIRSTCGDYISIFSGYAHFSIKKDSKEYKILREAIKRQILRGKV